MAEKFLETPAEPPRGASWHAILPAMKFALRALTVLALACAATGCASNPADRYEAPPNDGSVSANSADVVDNPGMPDNARKK